MDEQTASKIVELALGDFAPIRNEYRTRLYSAFLQYLDGGNLTATKNTAKRAVADGYLNAGELGYQDGGGTLPLDDAASAWLESRREAEFANIDNLFRQLKELRNDEEFTNDDKFTIANTRADGYTATLDSIYNEAKVRGLGNKMLTFGGQDGHAPDFPCPECKKLKGQRHRASWWVRRGYVPFPGNPNFTCGNWKCRHFMFDDDGKVVTL